VQVTAVLVAAVALAGPAPAPLPHGLLAFSGNCETCPPTGDGAALFTLRPDGRTLQIAISNASDPRWSPNGRELVFDRATPVGPSSRGVSEIWRSNADGSGLRRLTSGHNDSDADWSPTGKRLVFVRSEPARAPIGSLWLARRDSSSERMLMRTPIGGARDPEWSPDGRRIVFAASNDRIYEVGSNGRGLHLLRIRGRSPRYSPDGRLLAVVVGVRKNLIVNILDRSTGYVRTYLIGRSNGATAPLAWSVDGRWLAYGRPRQVRDAIGGSPTTYDLWALRLRDGRRQMILRNMELDGLDWRRQ
jgi:Tol biopolymer transport system component